MAVSLCLCLNYGSRASAQEADVAPQSKKIFAQRHFERGQVAFRSGEYDTALAAFKTSLELAHSPNTLLFISRSLRHLERNAEAANAYETTIRAAALAEEHAPRYAKTRDAARAELSPLRAVISGIRIDTDDSKPLDSVKVNGRAVPQEGLELLFYVEPGKATVELFFEDGSIEKQVVTAEAAKQYVVTPGAGEIIARSNTADESLSQPHAADATPTTNTLEWVGLGVGSGLAVVGFAGALGFSMASKEKYAELEEACGGPCSPPRTDDIKEGETYDTLANVGLVVGVVGVGIAIASAVALSVGHSDEQPQTESSLSFDVTGVTYRW